MTLLQVMPASDRNDIRLRTTDPERIRTELSGRGIVFERWAAPRPLDPDAGSDQVLAAYRRDVHRISAAGNYHVVDVVRIQPDDNDPEWPATARAAREKFLDEHVHDEDEVRFFVEGRGCFYLNLDGMVHAVVCEAGDLLSVPRGTRHWFDMGARPHLTAIRFFQQEDGWVATFTGEPTARQFPYLDELIGVEP